MSDYYKKRVEYINNWPDSTPFDAELEYKELCDNFEKRNGRLPFTPMKMWELVDDNYNRVLSNIIESLEDLPYKPNHSFYYLFMAFDYYTKKVYNTTNTTVNIKKFAHSIMNDPSVNNQVIINNILKELFGCLPLSTCKYFLKKINYDGQVRRRVVTNENNDVNNPIKAYLELIDFIINNYNYTDDKDRRNASRLCYLIFRNNTIKLGVKSMNIDNDLKLQFLISGIIYTSRNDFLHGSSMASTKSSYTSLTSYASNHYCFLALYTLLMLLLIEKSLSDNTIKNNYYTELYRVLQSNITDYKNLFGKIIIT